MRGIRPIPLIVPIAALILTALACTFGFSSTPTVNQGTTPFVPITIGNDLTQINLCQVIPLEDIQAVLGRNVVTPPAHFDFFGTPGASGCSYNAGKDSDNTAHFAYVVLTPIDAYNNQPLSMNVDVSGLGDAAYFNNGADARQLWVRIGDKVAFVIGIGDQANEDGARAIAELMVAAIK